MCLVRVETVDVDSVAVALCSASNDGDVYAAVANLVVGVSLSMPVPGSLVIVAGVGTVAAAVTTWTEDYEKEHHNDAMRDDLFFVMLVALCL